MAIACSPMGLQPYWNLLEMEVLLPLNIHIILIQLSQHVCVVFPVVRQSVAKNVDFFPRFRGAL